MGDKQVIKHSAAIHMSATINNTDRKAWNVLLANAYYDLPIKDEFEVSYQDFTSILEINNKSTTYVKQILTNLMKTVVEWNIFGKDTEIWEAYNLISTPKIIGKGKNKIIKYKYDEGLKHKLYNPSIFAKISLSIQQKFKGKYTLPLYELCLDYFNPYKKIGETPWMKINDYRRLMGIQSGQYKEFKILNKWTIQDPKKEINEKSDLLVEETFKREKPRKITHIKFHINFNAKNKNIFINSIKNTTKQLVSPQLDLKVKSFAQNNGHENKEINKRLFERMVKYFCVSPERAVYFLNKKEEKIIEEALFYVEKKYQAGKLDDIGAYTSWAIENEMTEQLSLFELEKINNKEKNQRKHEIKSFEEKLDMKYDDLYTRAVEEVKDKLSKEDLQQISENCLTIVKEKYDENNIMLSRLHRNEIEKALFQKSEFIDRETWKIQQRQHRPDLYES